MKTDVDTALKDIADFYVKNRRSMTEPELESILKRHVESKAEAEKFVKFLETEPGQLRFKTLLRERKPTYDLRTQKELDDLKAMRQASRLLKPSTLEETMFFNVPEAREQLISKGFVYTLRPRMRKTGKDVAYYGSYYKKEKIGDVSVDFVKEVKGKAELTEYVSGSGFLTVADWWAAAKGSTFLFKVTLEKPSYLKETVAETECQIISPQYYDILTWLNVPVPDYSFAIEPEVKERKIDEVLQKLKDGVARIHESAIFREFLTTMSKFWEYSIGNQILIMFQKPNATRVAGFVTWKNLGRHVKWGEKGIAILAPCLPPRILKCPLCEKTFTERELRTHLSAVHHREDVSILVREAREEAVGVPIPTYFKVVNVFDVSQTEGKPLPEIVVPVLSGAFSKELFDRLMALATKQSLTVSFEPKPGLSPEIKGSLLGKSIWVKGDEPEAQRLKTLGHELAHYFTEAVYFIPRADAEVIAESVAFVVCAHFSFDSGIRSFPYVALWAKEKKVLEQNLASIRKISGRMIVELGGEIQAEL